MIDSSFRVVAKPWLRRTSEESVKRSVNLVGLGNGEKSLFPPPSKKSKENSSFPILLHGIPTLETKRDGGEKDRGVCVHLESRLGIWFLISSWLSVSVAFNPCELSPLHSLSLLYHKPVHS